MDPLTPNQERLVSLLIYYAFGVVTIVLLLSILLLEWIRRKRKRQFDRKEFLIDQLSDRQRDVNLLIENIWQSQQKQ